MDDIITIQLRFGITTPLGLYQDWLYFTEDEWAKRDQKSIDVLKQKLADAWVVFRSAQLKEEAIIITKEGKLAKIIELDGRISDLTSTKDLLQSEIDAVP